MATTLRPVISRAHPLHVVVLAEATDLLRQDSQIGFPSSNRTRDPLLKLPGEKDGIIHFCYFLTYYIIGVINDEVTKMLI